MMGAGGYSRIAKACGRLQRRVERGGATPQQSDIEEIVVKLFCER